MRNVLILTFMFISVCCLGQVPTDWQLMNLKGKVKSIGIRPAVKLGYVGSDDLSINHGMYYYRAMKFDEYGYLISEVNTLVGGSSYKVLNEMRYVYTPYVKQVRKIIVTSSAYEKIRHTGVQFWSSPTDFEIVFDLFGVSICSTDKEGIRIKGSVDAAQRLLRIERVGLDKKISEFQSSYWQAECYQLPCFYRDNIDYNINILKEDAYGNVIEETNTLENNSIEYNTYTYEYYE